MKILKPKIRGLDSSFNNKGEFLPYIFWRKLINTIMFLVSRKSRNILKEYRFPVTFFRLNITK